MDRAEVVPVTLPPQGADMLRDPMNNKDSAFTVEERDRLGLRGLLPHRVLTLEQQVEMEKEHLTAKADALEQYIGLMALLDRNETLFYKLISDDLERFAPIIYTPTVGRACQHYSHIFRRPRGIYLCPDDQGRIEEILRNVRRDVRLIVVTDNERILGLGDQGAGGMGIPIGKLALYTAGAGIHPSLCLPISLDVGTDNAELLEDPFYLGCRRPRLRGMEYEMLVDEFVDAVKLVFPGALLQWEDFKKANAFKLLERYAGELPSFNDDIQGTAAVALAGILTGMRLTGQKLATQKILIVGAGAAGIGIARLLRKALAAEGLSEAGIRRVQLHMDTEGILWEGRAALEPCKAEFALRRDELTAMGVPDPLPKTLLDTVSSFRPTILIGTTGRPGSFTPQVIQAMASYCERPMIFPLSNPTSRSECTANDAIVHSSGRAFVATGSPFDPVEYGGRKYRIGQCNNAFVFPGVGLGVMTSQARRVTDSMFLAAANALADYTSRLSTDGGLYPRLNNLRTISRLIATRVAQAARGEEKGLPLKDWEIQAQIQKDFWEPRYEPLPGSPSPNGKDEAACLHEAAATSGAQNG